MREYKILTDSTTDLSPQLVAQTGVTVLPMTYTIGEKSYRNDPEETDLSSGDFYDMLRGGAMSTTSQINVETFREVAGKMARDGFDVLYVGFSSGLSGTFNSARIAFEDLSRRISGAQIPRGGQPVRLHGRGPAGLPCGAAAEGGPQH